MVPGRSAPGTAPGDSSGLIRFSSLVAVKHRSCKNTDSVIRITGRTHHRMTPRSRCGRVSR